MRTRSLKLLAAGAACLALGTASAQTAPETSAGTLATAAIPAGRIASRFEKLAGSPENAASLVTGLRSGSEIALASPDGSTGIAFTPTTRPMGYGNITRALSLAGRQLAAQGISNPTPEQLNAALNGGTVTTVNGSGTVRSVELDGVLQLRSQGMGWGQIAHRTGTSPGNAPAIPASGAAPARRGIDLPDSHHRHGAVVTGDGSLMHGRSPGFAGPSSAHASARGNGNGGIKAGTPAHGRSSFAVLRPAVSMGNQGRNAIKADGKGRL